MLLVLLAATPGLTSCTDSPHDSTRRDAAPRSSFPIPQHIAVSVAPYASVDAALNDEPNIDWTRELQRAQAITLAYAARELQEHLALIGINALIDATLDATDEPSFVLGTREQLSGSTFRRALRVEYPRLGDAGYAIEPVGKVIYVTGNNPSAVLNGVYRLLEYVGFAWYDPYETHVPRLATNRLAWRRLVEVPRVRFRGFWINATVPDEFAIWMARNRFNVGGTAKPSLQRKLGLKGWGGEHNLLQEEFSRPGLYEQHPQWYALVGGVRQPVTPTGTYFNPAFVNEDAAHYFSERMIERLERGDLRDVDILNIWPTDDRFNRFDQSPQAIALGNETDNLLQFYSVVSRRLRAAYEEGRLSREVMVAGISYYLTMEPPTNLEVTKQLRDANYLHIFYLNERSWSDRVDVDLLQRDASRKIMENLSAWLKAANLRYGIVEYYNYSVYAAIGLSDFPYLARNYQTLTSGRSELFAYMHPLLKNPGPRRLTNSLLAGLAWEDLSAPETPFSTRGEEIVQRFFAQRYGAYATRWREIYDLMSQSVDNSKEMFGGNSLYWVLFQELIWAEPPYTAAEAASFLPAYRLGLPDLPARFSGRSTVREKFRGLDDSIRLQESAARRWQEVLVEDVPGDIRARMEGDVAWFTATASRYRLMAATCDYVIARQTQQGLDAPRARMQREIELLQATPLTQDTITPIDQRSFLLFHKALAGIP